MSITAGSEILSFAQFVGNILFQHTGLVSWLKVDQVLQAKISKTCERLITREERPDLVLGNTNLWVIITGVHSGTLRINPT